MRKGFTLIELLVVVLIIGILSAVALPQYQVAVAKSRMATALPILKNLFEAQQIYFYANGKYSTSFEDLDIELPAGGILDKNKRKITYPNGMVFDIWTDSVSDSASIRALIDEDATYLLEFYLDGGHYCYAKANNTFANRVCKSFSGKEGIEQGTYFEYSLE